MTIIAQTTNPWITAFVGCAVLAAIISTATSLINAISSNISSDFSLSFFKKIDAKRTSQMITAFISIGSIVFAFYFDNIVDLLIQSYELSVSSLFIPIVFALFKKEGNFLSACLSILLGALGFLFFRIYPIAFPKEIGSVLLSLAGFSLGEIFRYYRRKILDLDKTA